jgi:hypothetical protein
MSPPQRRRMASGNERTPDAVSPGGVAGNHSSRGDVQIIRRVSAVLAGTAALATLAGCASQDPFGLPDLTPTGGQPGIYGYPAYGYGPGTGYPNGYLLGYDAYGNPYYTAPGPYPYGYGYGYGYGYSHGYAYDRHPRYIPVPCADDNRDGRCDTRPPKKHRQQDHDGGDHDVDEVPVRPRRNDYGEVPRVRDRAGRELAPAAQPRAVPAPAPMTQPPSQARPDTRQATPPEPATPRGPGTRRGRPASTEGDVAPSRPSQEP